MDTPFPSGLPLEVLDRVCDLDLAARNAGVRERLVEYGAGRADERLALPILLVARLLADEHDVRTLRPGAEHHLRGRLVEIATATVVCCRAQRPHARGPWDERRGGSRAARTGVVARPT